MAAAAAGAERSAGDVTPMPSLIRWVALAQRARVTNGSPCSMGVSYTQKLSKPSSSARTARCSAPGPAAVTMPVRMATLLGVE